MTKISELKPIFISEDAKLAEWMLYHPECGAYQMTIEGARGRKRTVSVKMPTGANQSSLVGTEASFRPRLKKVLKAELPATKASGEALMREAIAALTIQNSAEPLRLREGRTVEELQSTLTSLAYFCARQRRPMLCEICCDKDPDAPIRSIDKAALPIRNIIQMEILEWFAPRSPLGPLVKQNRHHFLRSSFSWLRFPSPPPHTDESAHDILEQLEPLRNFYERAAEDLNLSPDDVEKRLVDIVLVPTSGRA